MTTAPRPKSAHPSSGTGTKLYASYEPAPLSTERLAKIWRSLPEEDRYGFFLALREDLADRLLELTMPERKEL
jgi:hypothetical protein